MESFISPGRQLVVWVTNKVRGVTKAATHLHVHARCGDTDSAEYAVEERSHCDVLQVQLQGRGLHTAVAVGVGGGDEKKKRK